MSLYEQLMNAAFRFLSYRNRSEQEMKQYLYQKATLITKNTYTEEHLNQEITSVIVRLKELSYIDDHSFVRWWIDARSANNPKGERALRMELLRKGVDREILDQVFGSISSEDIDALARKAVSQKVSFWKDLPENERKKKFFSYLLRRGFSSDTIYRLIDEMSKKD